jgi:hypothetical protein
VGRLLAAVERIALAKEWLTGERIQIHGVGCVLFHQFFFIFFTLIYLDSPSFTFIHLHWNGSKKGVWRGFREKAPDWRGDIDRT